MASAHTNLCKQIQLAISASGGLASRNEQGYGFLPDGKTRVRWGLGPGTPDIVGVMPDGIAIVADAKIGKDGLRKRQRTCMEAVVSLGAHAVEVRDIKAFEQWLATGPKPTGEIVVC